MEDEAVVDDFQEDLHSEDGGEAVVEVSKLDIHRFGHSLNSILLLAFHGQGSVKKRFETAVFVGVFGLPPRLVGHL